MRCDHTVTGCTANTIVSIPAGFSDALRLQDISRLSSAYKQFQSLLGFLMRCDVGINGASTGEYSVSIPAGFSDALRLLFPSNLLGSSGEFQSLLGFLMRCDSSAVRRSVTFVTGFNPCWVF